jgi:type II secretory pathway pseudopilin PulG
MVIMKRRYKEYAIAAVAGTALLVILCILLLEDSRKAKEAALIAALRCIASGQELYKSQHGRYATMQELADSQMISQFVAKRDWSASKYGYYFTLNISGANWSCVAIPSLWGRTGTRNFMLRTDGCIIFNRLQGSTDFSNP